MAEEFAEQGGFATMDPNRMVRWLGSMVARRLADPGRLAKRRARAEKKRIRSGEPHVVEYFHQVEDGYSHLAAQVLRDLAARYDIQLVCHLVSLETGDNLPEPDLLLELSRYDASHVAPHYGLSFPGEGNIPNGPQRTLAESILAAQSQDSFAEVAVSVGEALWAGDDQALEELAGRHGRATPEQVRQRLDTGNGRRHKLGHYSGAMFYYGGEWYWGVDRLYHLEQRLAALGADRQPGQALFVPRPTVEPPAGKDDGSLTLEVYPSLRSPYTSISFDRAVQLARDTGVKLVVRPVLPMVMRGVPATREKGMYIFFDTAREAREAGVPYGNFYDPIGEPVRRAYSLYPWACEQGRGTELLSSFLKAAFAQGVNTNTDKGLQRVVEQAGLDWRQAKPLVGQPGWQDELETNRLAMYDSGLWGVPSFRLLDAQGKEVLALWGQDRLWLFAREIQRLLS